MASRSIASVSQGCMQATSMCLAPARRAAPRSTSRPPPAKGSGPRTRLAFLQQVVKKALAMPNTHNILSTTETHTTKPTETEAVASTTLLSSSPSSPKSASKRQRDACAIPSSAFTRYPMLPTDATKQPSGSTVLYKDEGCVLVNDAYPKSAVHCLIMPTDLTLLSLNDLEGKHIALIEHFVEVASAYTEFLKDTAPRQYARRRFITGFHALPSLPMLHIHLVSLDLDSPCLKTKKHYNSFATFFFLTSDRVLADLRQHGYITLNQDVKRLLEMEEQPMRCQWCGTPIANMPTLKQHLATCKLNKSFIS